MGYLDGTLGRDIEIFLEHCPVPALSTMEGFGKDLQMMIAFFYKGTCRYSSRIDHQHGLVPTL